jgi:hypothetical protein
MVVMCRCEYEMQIVLVIDRIQLLCRLDYSEMKWFVFWDEF